MAALALLGGAGPAAALGWNLTLNPGYSSSSTLATDETGHRSKTDFTGWTQRYRLTLDQQLWPLATLSAGGTFEQLNGASRTDGVRSDFENQTWNGFASLRMGARPLSGGLDYTRREQAADLTAAQGSVRAPTLVRESYGATLSLTPADLPSLDVQVTRTDTYDKARATQDRTADSLTASSRWAPVRRLDLSYGLTLARDEDRKSRVETTGVANSLSARYGDSFWGGRVSSYLSYQAATRSTSVHARGPGGTVQVLQPVALGYSKVETFSDRPAKVTLNPNAELSDGNTAVRAGLNLGWGASAAGDRANRDIGAQFPNAITPVNFVYVYVDRPIPTSVAATLTWTAYTSGDNQVGDWTPVNVAGTVTFDPLANRFQIPIDRVEARYVKVVTAPLGVGVSTDPALSEINVTEIQFYLEESASDAQRRASLTFSESASATLRVGLIPRLNLSYDFAGMVTHTIDPTRYTWTTTNSVGLANRLTPTVAYTARVSRADSDAGQGHLAQNQWTAALSLDPLPTLGGSLSYAGQVTQDQTGNSLSNAFGATARAELYQGIAAGANGSWAISESPTSRMAENAAASASLSLVPNRVVSTSGSIGYTWTRQYSGGLPTVSDRAAVAEGSATVSPFQALALSGSIRRTWLGEVASTSGSLSAAASFLRGGALQGRYAYVTSFETAARLRTTTHGPGLRWNIRTGWYVDGSANWTETKTPAQTVETEAYFANLVISLK